MTLVTRASSIDNVSLQGNHSTIKRICHTLLNDTPKLVCIKRFSISRPKKAPTTAKNMPFCRLLNDKNFKK